MPRRARRKGEIEMLKGLRNRKIIQEKSSGVHGTLDAFSQWLSSYIDQRLPGATSQNRIDGTIKVTATPGTQVPEAIINTTNNSTGVNMVIENE